MERRILADGRFVTTQWSIVRTASSAPDPARLDALDYLLRCYCPALVEYLKRQFRFSEDHANDMVQSFVEDRVLTKNLLDQASQKRGKFRTFLLKSFQSFTLDQIKLSQRQKRHPVGGFTSLDESLVELDTIDLEVHQTVFDDGFARQVIAEAIHRTHQKCLADNAPEIWEVLYARALAPHLEEAPPEDYAVLIKDLRLKDIAEAYNKLASGKRMFREFFKAVVEEFASDENEFEEELRYLRRFFDS